MNPPRFEEFGDEPTLIRVAPSTLATYLTKAAGIGALLLLGLAFSPRPTANAADACCVAVVESHDSSAAFWSWLGQIPLPAALVVLGGLLSKWKPELALKVSLDAHTRRTLRALAKAAEDEDE